MEDLSLSRPFGVKGGAWIGLDGQDWIEQEEKKKETLPDYHASTRRSNSVFLVAKEIEGREREREKKVDRGRKSIGEGM